MKRVLAALFTIGLAFVLVGTVVPVVETPTDVGEVNNVTHDAPLDIEPPFDQDELELLATRAMARIETIRGLSFDETVDIEVMTREAYQERANRSVDETQRTWENLRWQALFIIGDDRDAVEVLDEAFATGVQGFYSPSENRVVVVSEAENTTVNKGTLIHELVHALQDQQFGIGSDGQTTDGELAYDGLLEGEAELIPERYFDRCTGIWHCLIPETQSAESEVPTGVQRVLLAPYTEGPAFIDASYERGGWDAVNELYNATPQTGSEILHPERYPAEPANITVPDRSTDDWERLSQPQTDRLGEIAIHAMFAHNGVTTTQYRDSYSNGWAGDEFVPYRTDEEFGYVWKTVWESHSDAEQFEFAYRDVLSTHGAVSHGDGRYTVPDGPFAGAYRVTVTGDEVHIVNAPATGELAGVHDSRADAET